MEIVRIICYYALFTGPSIFVHSQLIFPPHYVVSGKMEQRDVSSNAPTIPSSTSLSKSPTISPSSISLPTASSTLASPIVTTTPTPVSEPDLSFYIPTKSSDPLSQSIGDYYTVNQTQIMVFSIAVGLDYPQIKTPGVQDMYNYTESSFPNCVHTCADWNWKEHDQADITTMCTAVSLNAGVCFWKQGVNWVSTAGTENGEVLSAVLHLLDA